MRGLQINNSLQDDLFGSDPEDEIAPDAFCDDLFGRASEHEEEDEDEDEDDDDSSDEDQSEASDAESETPQEFFGGSASAVSKKAPKKSPKTSFPTSIPAAPKSAPRKSLAERVALRAKQQDASSGAAGTKRKSVADFFGAIKKSKIEHSDVVSSPAKASSFGLHQNPSAAGKKSRVNQDARMAVPPTPARASPVSPAHRIPRAPLPKLEWKPPTAAVKQTTALRWLRQQCEAVDFPDQIPNNAIKFQVVPPHYTMYEVVNPLFSSEKKTDLTDHRYNAGPNLSADDCETLVEATLTLDKKISKQLHKYWWKHGMGLEKVREGEVDWRGRRNKDRSTKWVSRFDNLFEDGLDMDDIKGRTNTTFQPRGWSEPLPGNRDKAVPPRSPQDYWTASLKNIKKLTKRVEKFHDGDKQWNEVRGAIDEQCFSSLGLPVVLQQDPEKFGANLAKKSPGSFGTWNCIGDDVLEQSGAFDRHLDMRLCQSVAKIFEEKIYGQCASSYFVDGSTNDKPFGLMFEAENLAKGKYFCEYSGRWVARTDSAGGQMTSMMHQVGNHLYQQLYRKFKWQPPNNMTDSANGYVMAGGRAETANVRSLRMFQQTVGADIGVVIDFQYVSDKKVRVQLACNFEILLRRMLFMSYWEHDRVTARWRMLVQPFKHEDIVKLDHRQAPVTFTMKNSLDMPIVPSPEAFTKYKLKGEQPYTLSWMYYREGRSHDGKISSAIGPAPFDSNQTISRRIAGSDVVVEVEVVRSYERVKGGILGDQVGYGKTACMIGLVVQTQLQDPIHSTIADWELPYAQEYVFTNATLIVTPHNLFQQWSDEFKKFVDTKKMKLNILKIGNHAHMKKFTFQDFVDADVVLVSFRFFFSECYRKYFDKEVGLVERNGSHYYSERLIKMRRRTADMLRTRAYGGLLGQKGLIEAVYWKRVVFDEFHEVVQLREQSGDHVLTQYALRHLQARYRWGLTATPLLASTDEVSQMANLLHVFLPNNNEKQAQHFVNEYIRANKWNVGDVPLEEKWMKVTHSPEERALYMNQEQNARANGGLNQLTSPEFEKLLQFCSHFAPDGTATNAGAAIKNIRAEKMDRIKALKPGLDAARAKFEDIDARKQHHEKFQHIYKVMRTAANVGKPPVEGFSAYNTDTPIFVHTNLDVLEAAVKSWEPNPVLHNLADPENIYQIPGSLGNRLKLLHSQAVNTFHKDKYGNSIHCDHCSRVRQFGGATGNGFDELHRHLKDKLKKNLANKIFGYLARCEFWLKLGW